MNNSVSASSTDSTANRPLHVVVIVLGDVGRSPRMQYHALSLLQEGYTVSLVGYTGEDLIPLLKEWPSSHLNVVRFTTSAPSTLRTFLPPLYLIWRLFSLIFGLVRALRTVSAPSTTTAIATRVPAVDCVLVQNPPAIPLLAVSYLYCVFLGLVGRRRRRPGLVIDWHNLGYTMFDSPGRVQQLARWYEKQFGPLADGHLCVTLAMKLFLQEFLELSADSNSNSNSNIKVLYDCPPVMFQPLAMEEQHQLLKRLHTNLCTACPKSWYENLTEHQTLLTDQSNNNGGQSRRGRPALITSSTSWTADEDFGLLLDALVQLDEKITSLDMLLNIMIVVTGKGPLKEFYQEKMSKLHLNHVAVHTLWLEPGDYPKLLACADMGMSLHTSTSGLDLPMKVLDLFGCETPVCALDFTCLPELVQDRVNGRVFEPSDQLAEQILTLLKPLAQDKATIPTPPHEFGALAEYSNNLKGRKRWSENWKENALPVLRNASNI